MKIKRSSCFETSDGKTFKRSTEACDHEANIQMELAFKKFVEDKFCGGEVFPDEILTALIQNVDELKEILTIRDRITITD